MLLLILPRRGILAAARSAPRRCAALQLWRRYTRMNTHPLELALFNFLRPRSAPLARRTNARRS
jgi:hypothetical protein